MTETAPATADGESAGDVALVLYVAGRSPNSEAARGNLDRALRSAKDLRVSVRVADVARDPETALRAGVMITPSLVRERPGPRRTLIGDLREADRLADLLRPGAG